MSSDLQIFEVKILYTTYDLDFIRFSSPMQLINIIKHAYYVSSVFNYSEEFPFVPCDINYFNISQSVHLQCLSLIMYRYNRDIDITSIKQLFNMYAGECKSYLQYIMNDDINFVCDPYFPSVEQFYEYYIKFITGHDYECFEYVKNLCGNVEIPFPD